MADFEFAKGGGKDVGGPDVTAYLKVYGWTVHEETGRFGVIVPSCRRLGGLIAWPTLAVCIGIGAAGGAYLRRVFQARRLV
jgi:hypothetical protein